MNFFLLHRKELRLNYFNDTNNELFTRELLKAGGFGFNIHDATNSYLGELIERVTLLVPFLDNIEVYTEKFLTTKGYNYISIQDLINSKHAIPITNNVNYKDLNEKIYIPYVKGKILPSNETVYVPAYAVYFNHNFVDKNIVKPNKSLLKYIKFLTTSNGVAAGASKDFAISRSIMEIIERHDFMILWLTSSAMEPLAIYELPNLTIYIGKFNTLDGNYESIFSIFLRKDEPKFGIGGASDYDHDRSIIRSLKEVLASYLSLIYYRDFYVNKDIKELKRFDNFETNTIFYSISEGYNQIHPVISNILMKFSSIKKSFYLDFIDLIRGSESTKIQNVYSITPIENLIKLNNLNIILIEIPTFIEDIYVYKALSLELLPLPIPEYTKYLVDHNFIIKNNIKVKNTLPHPYP